MIRGVPRDHSPPPLRERWPGIAGTEREGRYQTVTKRAGKTLFSLFPILLFSTSCTVLDWASNPNSLLLQQVKSAQLRFVIVMLIVLGLASAVFLFGFGVLWKNATNLLRDLYKLPDDPSPAWILWNRWRGNSFIKTLSLGPLPYVMVQDAKKGLPSNYEWARQIGGPATLVVFDGCALYLERGNRFSRVVGPGSKEMLGLHERIAAIVDLRPQVKVGQIKAWTKDGIRVSVEARLECRIGPETPQNEASQDLIYPFDPESVRLAVERTAVKLGKEKGEIISTDWLGAAWGQLTGIIANHIAGHHVDALFLAERGSDYLLAEKVTEKLRTTLAQKTQSFGVHVLDLQITVVKPPPEVEELRRRFWGTTRDSVSMLADARAEAFRVHALEQARAEAQRDLIKTIAEKLSQIDRIHYDEAILFFLSNLIDQGLKNPFVQTYLAGEALKTLEELRKRIQQ
ncbi:MAG: hypothetical protein D6770_01250 [Anaerolineae bacterium]|nr:MAG: hypothetical protein D6770_01250 [Anaerolineae bacterium]